MLNRLLTQPKLILTYLLFAVFPANGLLIPMIRNWTILQLVVIALFILIAIDVLFGKNKLSLDRWFFLWCVLFIIVAIASIIFKPERPEIVLSRTHQYYHPYGELDILYLIWMVLNFLMILMIVNVIKTKEQFFTGLKIILYSSVLYAGYAFYQFLVVFILGEGARSIVYSLKETYLWGPEAIRSPSLSREPLFYSFYLIIVILLCAMILYDKSKEFILKMKTSKLVIVAILLVNIVAFFAGRPTAGFIALVGAIVLLFYTNWRFSWRISIKSTWRVISIFIMSCIVLMTFAAINFDRIERRLTRATDVSSGYMRLVSILEGVEHIRESPVIGFGIGNGLFFISTEVVHNMYVGIMAEMGVIGFLVFCSLLIMLWIRTKRLRKFGGITMVLSDWVLCALFAFLIQWLSFFSYSLPEFWVFTAIIILIIKLFQPNLSNAG